MFRVNGPTCPQRQKRSRPWIFALCLQTPKVTQHRSTLYSRVTRSPCLSLLRGYSCPFRMRMHAAIALSSPHTPAARDWSIRTPAPPSPSPAPSPQLINSCNCPAECRKRLFCFSLLSANGHDEVRFFFLADIGSVPAWVGVFSFFPLVYYPSPLFILQGTGYMATTPMWQKVDPRPRACLVFRIFAWIFSGSLTLEPFRQTLFTPRSNGHLHNLGSDGKSYPTSILLPLFFFFLPPQFAYFPSSPPPLVAFSLHPCCSQSIHFFTEEIKKKKAVGHLH